MNQHIDHILKMRTSLVKNYGLPGVDSSLINNGLVRLFESHRHQQDAITPHSHKFDFCCLVLSGEVLNRVWTYDDENGDEFEVSNCSYQGDIGKYEKYPSGVFKFSYKDSYYKTGDWYGMTHDQIHSIWFSKECKVLFFEGAVITNETKIIEPSVSGKHLKTFEVKDWMFDRSENGLLVLSTELIG